MKLDLAQLKAITTGAVSITQEEDGFHLRRFTPEQQEMYLTISPNFHMKSFATSGVKLRFRTDSKNLFLKTFTTPGSSRAFFAFDVFVNGKMIDSLCNYVREELPQDYTDTSIVYPLGAFEKNFDLGEGDKEVWVYFPYSVKAVMEEISVDDGAYLEPVKYSKTMILYGDSITHGYDALHPSSSAFTRLAERLDCEEINKGIGGDVFCPQLPALKDPVDPEYILVGYGTNEHGRRPEDFQARCREFYDNIEKSYPNAKVIALTPIWRKDKDDNQKYGPFLDLHKTIREIVAGRPNVTVVEGYDLVPHDGKYFGDLRLHPSDKGFDYYYEGMCKQLFGE